VTFIGLQVGPRQEMNTVDDWPDVGSVVDIATVVVAVEAARPFIDVLNDVVQGALRAV